jgi:hypothetical protein
MHQLFFIATVFYRLLLTGAPVNGEQYLPLQRDEEKLVRELFRLRNEHKADSAELYYADTVKVYMKYLRNIPRRTITLSDKQFWKDHPRNKFEITAPIQIKTSSGGFTAFVYGKEFLDGTMFKYEKIEIKFNRSRKIYFYRGYHWKGS